MKQVTIKFEIKTEGGNTKNGTIHTEYDSKKWAKIQDICNERKANITNLLESYLEKLTPEEAKNIVISWDM